MVVPLRPADHPAHAGARDLQQERLLNGRWAPAAACLVAALLAHAARAQEEFVQEQGVALADSLRLEAGLDSEVRWTDNLYLTEEHEESATGFLFEPELALSYLRSRGAGRLGYRGGIGFWDSPGDDDYVDSEAFASGALRPLSQHALEVDGSYKRGHDPIGTARTQGLVAPEDRDLDLWDYYKAAGRYTYGGPESKLHLFARGSFVATRYATNRSDPVDPGQGTRFLDHDRILAGGGALYAIGPKTGVLLDAEHTWIEYRHDLTPSLDGAYSRGLLGLRGELTAKIKGDALIGYFHREFDSRGRDDASGLDWLVALDATPLPRSALRLESGRTITEQVLLGENFADRRYVRLAWRQDWTRRAFSEAAVLYAREDFKGIDRDDDLYQGRVTLGYALTRRWTVRGGVEHSSRKSSISVFDYDATTVLLGLDVRL